MSAPEVGEHREFVKPPVSTTQLVMYAGASGDFNRIHFDSAFAREAGQPDVIAHGLLTMAFAGQLVSDWAGERGQVHEIGGRLTAPVRVGDVVTVEATVEAVGAGGDVKLRLTGHTPRGQVFVGDARYTPGDD